MIFSIEGGIGNLESKIDQFYLRILDDMPESNATFFNFEAYSKVFTEAIQNDYTKTPLTMGIFGDWGSGKTSLMRTIESRIKGLFFAEDINEDYINSFILKLCGKRNDIYQNISLQLYNQFSPESREKLKNFADKYYVEEFKAPSHEIEKIKKVLIKELNILLEKPRIFDKEYFSIINNRTNEINKLIRKKSRRKEHIIHLNRLLLENIYSKEINKKPEANYVRTIWFNAWKYDKKRNFGESS